MSISEKAVEAAARALAEHDDPDTSWGELTLYWHEHYCAEARVVLKAALPLHQHAPEADASFLIVAVDAAIEAIDRGSSSAPILELLRAARTQFLGARAALAAAPPAPALHQHAQPAGREALMHAAKSAVEQWADWCHNNEAQWSGWGDMVVPEGATMWTADAERVLAAFAPPAPVQEDLDRREIACLRAAVTDAGAYIALCPPPPEATGSLRIELLERRERIGKAAALIAEKDAKS